MHAYADLVFCAVVLTALLVYVYPAVVAGALCLSMCFCVGLAALMQFVVCIDDAIKKREEVKRDLYWASRRESWDAHDKQLEAAILAEQAAAAEARLEEEQAQEAARFEAFRKNDACVREYQRILARRLSFPPGVRCAYADQREFTFTW